MIDRLEGRVVTAEATRITLAVGPMIMELMAPVSTTERLPEPGGSIQLWTHLQWKEDGPTLFGFFSAEERQFFRLLIGVNGVGPRIALAVLGHLPPSQLVAKLRERDEAVFMTVSGVGKKTAGRILVELGPYADKMTAFAGAAEESPFQIGPRIDADALQALTSLGYSSKDSDRALRDVVAKDSTLPVEEQIRHALRSLTARTAGKR
jgi:Holliday junction DNA helicase RuvA